MINEELNGKNLTLLWSLEEKLEILEKYIDFEKISEYDKGQLEALDKNIQNTKRTQ